MYYGSTQQCKYHLLKPIWNVLYVTHEVWKLIRIGSVIYVSLDLINNSVFYQSVEIIFVYICIKFENLRWQFIFLDF